MQCCSDCLSDIPPLYLFAFLEKFFSGFGHCLLVHAILSPNRILILGFSFCNVNCAVTGLQEDESTDGWGRGGGLQKQKKILGDGEMEKSLVSIDKGIGQLGQDSWQKSYP